MNVEELFALVEAGKLIRHHSAWRRGYTSRKVAGIVSPYEGKFGKGFILAEPNWGISTQYTRVTYYIEEA